MDFNGAVLPTRFNRPVTFLRGCTLVTVVQNCVVYSDGLCFFRQELKHDNQNTNGPKVEMVSSLTLVFLEDKEKMQNGDFIVVLHAIRSSTDSQKHIAMVTLQGYIYVAELMEDKLLVALLHKTFCYGAKNVFSGTAGTDSLLCTVCSESRKIFFFNITQASLIFETYIDVDVPIAGAIFNDCLYIVCKESLISYSLVSQSASSLTITFGAFVRLSLNGSRVLCASFSQTGVGMFLLGLNTRQVFAIDTAGVAVSTWCKVSKYEPLYLFKSHTQKQTERLIIAAVSNEVTTQSVGKKGRASEFRTDGMIIGCAEADACLVFLTERSIYYYCDKDKDDRSE